MKTDSGANSKVKDDDEVEKVKFLIGHIGEHERHFNVLEADYRKLSSAWLLACLGACGYILKKDGIGSLEESWRWYLIFGICIAGSVGIGILWMLDIKVYHRLLHSFFKEGVRLEVENLWLNPIRINMTKSQKSGDIVDKVQYFYFLSILLLLLISDIAIFQLDLFPKLPLIKYGLPPMIVLIPITVFLFILKRKSGKTEIEELIDEYDKKQLMISNIEIGEAEQKHDYVYLKKVLSEKLEFIRADGTSVNRANYLIQLQTRKYDEIHTTIEGFAYNEEITGARVVAIVTAKGTNDRKAFEGVYRNERLWRKEDDGKWRLVEWKNSKISIYGS